MAKAGCQVLGYDHTVDVQSSLPDFHIFKLGIAKSLKAETAQLKSLETLMKNNGHGEGTQIDYIKKSVTKW